MQNELLSVPVAAGAFAVTGGWIIAVCHKLKRKASSQNFALMGILGAFVFAAQMINFPVMPGTSGHMIGAILLAIILGPHLGMIVLTSVVIVQCLLFQDGGILALGCNILNMAIIPVYLGYFTYKLIIGRSNNNFRLCAACVIASLLGLECGAILVSIQVGLSEVLSVPIGGFLSAMLGVHLITGVIEGLITAAILGYLVKVRPQLIDFNPDLTEKPPVSIRAVCITFLVAAVITAGGISLLASEHPDGLERCYADVSGEEHHEPVVENESSDGWESLAGVGGAMTTMMLIIAVTSLIRRKDSAGDTNICTMHT